MKIIFITPVYRQFTHQPQNSWRRALIKLGHQVKLFPLKYRHLKLVNSFKLKILINSYQPNQIFFSAGLDALLPIKHTIFFSGVPFSTLSHHEQLIGLKSKLVVTNDPSHAQDWANHGAHQAVCLPISAIDPQLQHKAKPLKKYQSDVCFIGGLSLDRQKLFQKLINAGIKLKLFGTLPDNFLSPLLQPIYFGPVWGKTIAKVYSSTKIALNPLPKHMPVGGNLRTFEIPGCAAFQLASRTHPDWFTDSKDIILYKNHPDLIRKINYYLTHGQVRQRIARSGYLRAHQHHTYHHRFKKLLKIIDKL